MRQVGSEFVVTIARFFSEIGPAGQNTYVLIHTLLLLGMVLLVLHAWLKQTLRFEKTILKPFFYSDALFTTLLFLFILIGRFPNALYGYMNPDEGVWIACAKTFLVDPRPWVSADTTTSGPLVVLPLLVLKVFGLPLDFGSVKVASGITLASCAAFTFLANQKLFGSLTARLTILIFAMAISMTSFTDFITYNGEQMPLLLLSISFWLLGSCLVSAEQKRNHILAAGIVLGMLPFAKLQSAPMGLLAAAFAFYILYLKKHPWKHFAYFAIAGSIPTIMVLLWLMVAGGLDHFWNSYISINLFYAASGTEKAITLIEKINLARLLISSVEDTRPYFQISLCIGILSLLFLDYKLLWKNKVLRSLSIFSILYLFTSLYCIGQSYRWFEHYVLLSFPAFNLLATVLLSSVLIENRHQSVLVLAVLFTSSLYFFQLYRPSPKYFDYVELRKGEYSNLPEVVAEINKYSVPGGRIVVWGWSNTFYGDTDQIPGTRLTDTAGMLTPNPFSSYVESIFLSDMKRNSPGIFLDAISPGAFRFYDRGTFGFEHFPAVYAYVSANYKLQSEVSGFRIYVRR